MSPVLRTFLMWLLMLAIPVQGFAASTMLHCGPGHQQQQRAAAAMGGHEAHAAHHRDHAPAHADAAHHGMSAAADPSTSVDGANGTAVTDGGTSTPVPAAKCSACAYCCHAVAIMGTPPAIGVATPDSAPEAAVPPRVEATVPDGLDRPPRLPLV